MLGRHQPDLSRNRVKGQSGQVPRSEMLEEAYGGLKTAPESITTSQSLELVNPTLPGKVSGDAVGDFEMGTLS